MTRAIIVEDEPEGMANLEKLLDLYCPTIEIVGKAESNKEFIALIDSLEEQPDVAFLDINLPDGKVFEGLAELDDVSFDVIFVTAFDEYALRAFDVAAVDYILKPFEPDELVRAVGRLRPSKEERYTAARMEMTRMHLSEGTNAFEKIAISATDGIHLVRLSDVMRLEGDDNYTHFFKKSGEKVTASKTLKTYELMLEQLNFLRIHKKYIVNLNYINRYERGDGGTLHMDDGRALQVSRRKKGDLLRVLRLVNRG